jgi:hypothetical protein
MTNNNNTHATLPTTGKEAAATGELHYCTGKACKHGHFAARYASTHGCVECVRQQRPIRAGRTAKPAPAASAPVVRFAVDADHLQALIVQLVASGASVSVEVRH